MRLGRAVCVVVSCCSAFGGMASLSFGQTTIPDFDGDDINDTATIVEGYIQAVGVFGEVTIHTGLDASIVLFQAVSSEENDAFGYAVASHELGHALGFEHICGFVDVKSNEANTNGTNTSCVMMYRKRWLYNRDNFSEEAGLRPWSELPVATDFCAKHIIEIRKTNYADKKHYVLLGWEDQ